MVLKDVWFWQPEGQTSGEQSAVRGLLCFLHNKSAKIVISVETQVSEQGIWGSVGYMSFGVCTRPHVTHQGGRILSSNSEAIITLHKCTGIEE